MCQKLSEILSIFGRFLLLDVLHSYFIIFVHEPFPRRALPLEPDPDLDPYITRFINVLHAHNEGRRFARPEDLREVLFPAWKSMVRS